MQRRQFLEMAAALGASLAWARSSARNSASSWQERREFFPQGVASGDPQPDSVLLWTRRPPIANTAAQKLTLELATDATFRHVVATSSVALSDANDWTCRVLAAGLKPATTYWYRFTDEHGHGSRIGRTITAPATNDARTRALCIRELPERLPGSAERISPHDLRGRAARRSGAARLRAAPGRFHLRGGLVSGGSPAGNVRSPPARRGALQERRESA